MTPESIARADRILERISPSQVEAFELCPRRWYNASVLGLREPTTPAQQRGIDVADVLEHYYKAGEIKETPYRDLVDALIAVLGPRSELKQAEEWLEAPLGDGLPNIRGRYDLMDFEIGVRDVGSLPSALLSDVKVRSDKRYAKTPEQLSVDTQLNTYGRILSEQFGFDRLAMRHVYGLYKNAKAFPVTVVLEREQFEPRWEKTIETARQMVDWAKARPENADPLPPNTEACGKFPPHGCPHKALCGFAAPNPFATTAQQPETKEVIPVSNLLERLKKQNEETTPAPVNVEPSAADIEDLKKRTLGALSRFRTAPTQDNNTADDAAVESKPPERVADVTAPVGEAVLPSVAEKPEQCPRCGETLTDGNAARQPNGTFEPLRCPVVRAEKNPILPPDMPARVNFEEEAKPSKRGRPKKTEAPADVSAAAAWLEKLVAAVPVAKAVAGLVLYVNCIPSKGPDRGSGVYMEEWIAPLMEELAKEKNVADWRLIQYTAKGDLAAKIRANVSSLPRVILVSKFSPAADVFLEAVIPYAFEIVQGV